MFKKFFLAIITLFFATSLFAQGDQPAANRKKARLLIGTWKLLEFADLDSVTKQWTYRYGEKPKGYFTYTRSGIVNINISATNSLKISEDSTKKFYPKLYDFIQHTGFGYFGHYTIDWEKSTVIHHVEGGTIPYYIDTDQPRQFQLRNDTLIIGDQKTWRRVLVKLPE